MHDPNKLYFLLIRFYEDEVNDIKDICIERNYNYPLFIREKLTIHKHDTLPIIYESSKEAGSSEITRINVMENIPTRLGSKYVTYDSGEVWELFFQDNHIDQGEILEAFHNIIMFYSAIILIVLTWILILILIYYLKLLLRKKINI